MCGSVPVPSGPFAILLFPLLMGASTINSLYQRTRHIKYRIRENNKRIDNGIKYRRQEWKDRLKEKVLYRKQYKAEKSLVGKMKIAEYSMDLNQDQQPTEIISTEDAILYLQRSVVRISSNKFEKALGDVKFAVYLDYTFQETYVVYYLEGFILYMLGDYLESAHTFKKAIELKEAEDEASKQLEKKVFEIQNAMKHRSEKIVEFHEQTKTYLKSAHKKLLSKLTGSTQDVQQPQEEEEPDTSVILLEELYYRAGISYYFSTYYSDSITYYSKAIEIGKNNPNIHHYFFNRGLSYFYSHEVDLALQDFLDSQSLIETDEVDKMIAYTYGRKGMNEKKSEYIKKAIQINPNTKISPFIYRLLDENCTELIFSFLTVQNLVSLSRTGKHWREIAMRSIANQDIFEISLHSMFNDINKHLKKENAVSLKEKLFMPAHVKISVTDLLDQALGSSVYQTFIEKPGKRIDCFMMSTDTNMFQYMHLGVNGLKFFKEVEYLNIAQNGLREDLIEVLTRESPNLKELTIRTGTYVYKDVAILNAIPTFTNLKKLAWHFDFTCDPSILSEMVFPPSLEIFEHAIESSTVIEQNLAPSYPNVKFVPIENVKQYALDYCDKYEEVDQ